MPATVRLLSVCSLLLVLLLSTSACKVRRSTGLSNIRTGRSNEPKKPEAPKPELITGEMALRLNAVHYAKQYIGSRYKYAGRDPSGFDCSGFTSYVLKNQNVEASPSSKVQATQGKAVALENVQPGDLVFFSRNGRANNVTHVALVVDNKADGIYVIHSTSSRGVIVENVSTSAYWKPKIVFARDIISGSMP